MSALAIYLNSDERRRSFRGAVEVASDAVVSSREPRGECVRRSPTTIGQHPLLQGHDATFPAADNGHQVSILEVYRLSLREVGHSHRQVAEGEGAADRKIGQRGNGSLKVVKPVIDGLKGLAERIGRAFQGVRSCSVMRAGVDAESGPGETSAPAKRHGGAA